MSAFEPLPLHELQRLSDEETAGYIAGAYDAGALAAAQRAANILAYAWEPRVKTWVAAKVTEQDVDDVVEEVLLGMTLACYAGKAIGRFGGFLRGIAHNKIVDHYRVLERRGETVEIDVGREEDDSPVFVPKTSDESGTVDVAEAVGRVLSTRSELHQEVLRLYCAGLPGFEDLRAKDAADRINEKRGKGTMSEANVNQIFRRFKVDLEAELDG